MAKLSLKGAALESFVLTVTDGCMTTCQKMICSFPMVAQVTFSVQGLTKKRCRTKFQIFFNIAVLWQMDHVIIKQWDAILMVVSIWPFRIVCDVFYLLTRSIITISFVGGTVISFASHLASHLWMILHLGSSANWYCSDSAEHMGKN